MFASLQRDAAGNPAYAIGVIQDISERKRLDLTAEAVIVEETKWHPLFTAEELEICRKRLRDYGYPYPPA